MLNYLMLTQLSELLAEERTFIVDFVLVHSHILYIVFKGIQSVVVFL